MKTGDVLRTAAFNLNDVIQSVVQVKVNEAETGFDWRSVEIDSSCSAVAFLCALVGFGRYFFGLPKFRGAAITLG